MATRAMTLMNHRSSRRCGQALAECCAGLLIVVPILLILLDCVFVFMGASLNDSVCRDAARAAASGQPSSLTLAANRNVGKTQTPNQRAVAVIKHVYYSGLPMKVRETVAVVENVRDVPPVEQGGAIDGDVTVSTTIDIYPPFRVTWINSGIVVLRSKHTVAFTYVRPAASP